MMLKQLALLCGVSFALQTLPVHADNLWQVYQQALHNAPQLQSYQYQNLANQEGREIAFAPHLPQVSLTGSITQLKPSGGNSYRAESANLQVAQNIFNAPVNFSYLSASNLAAASQSTYTGQQQSFIINVVSAYFGVTNAEEDLRYNQARVQFLKETLDQIEAKFHVGIATYTDLAQAKANYDQAIATEIKAQNALTDAYQNLWIYTGHPVKNLLPLSEKIKFALPRPADDNIWVKEALAHNAALKAQKLTTQSSEDAMKSGYAAFLPSVSVVGQVTYNANNAKDLELAAIGYRHQRDESVALNFTWNLFNGGSTWASAKQLADKYASQSATWLSTYRQTIVQTRQDYLAVVADVSLVKSYQLAVTAAQSSLKQLQAKYRLGSETLVNVLNGVEQLFQAQLNLSSAKHDYVIDQLKLDMDAGKLNDSHVQEINRWLTAK